MVVPFPFSDLSQAKRRPALVLSETDGNDLICQITSQPVRDRYAIAISDHDFESGSLRQTSNVRPNHRFTADEHIVLYRAGRLKSEKMGEITAAVTRILS